MNEGMTVREGGKCRVVPREYSINDPCETRVKDPGGGRYLELSAGLPLKGFSH